MLKLIPLLVLLLGLSPVQAKEIYKWMDDDNRVRYSELPPQNRPYEVLDRPSSNQQDTNASEQESPNETVVDEQERRAQQAEEASVAAESTHSENCQQARLNLQILQESENPVQVDAEGNETVLEETQRQEAIERNRQYLERYCNS